MLKLSDEQLLYILDVQLPEMLERNPELEPRAFRAFFKIFTTKEQTAAILAELREFRGEFQHFRTEVENRFGQVDQRFDQVDQRLESIDRRFDQLDRKMDDLRDWVELVVGRFQVRSGRKLEDVVAGTLRLALHRPDITPNNIRLRQKVVDEQGVIGPAGQSYEVDILADDGQITVFEVKSACEAEDVDHLADKVALIRALHPDQKVEGVMVALGIEDEAEARCAQYGLSLVH
jgi:predicted nuclease with TOPRIM domain